MQMTLANTKKNTYVYSEKNNKGGLLSPQKGSAEM